MVRPCRRRGAAIDPATGAVLQTAPIDALVANLAVAPAGPAATNRLLCACGAADPNKLGRDALFEAAASWQLLAFIAESLEPAAVYPLLGRPDALAAAPDGGAAYALIGGVDVASRASLIHVDLGGGGARTLTVLPGRAAALAVGAQQVYVPYLDGQVVWVVDRSRGRLVRTLPAGHHPLAVALVSGTGTPKNSRQ